MAARFLLQRVSYSPNLLALLTLALTHSLPAGHHPHRSVRRRSHHLALPTTNPPRRSTTTVTTPLLLLFLPVRATATATATTKTPHPFPQTNLLPPPPPTPQTPTLPPSTYPPHPFPPLEPTTLRPSPTTRLAAYIRTARLSTYTYSLTLESHINTALTTLLTREHQLTSTLSSLRPPPSSNEALLPGTLYVLVGTMAGSIVARNRNILLRATVPVAAGVGVAWVVLPETMRNVSEKVWEVEREWPVVAVNHLRVRGAVEEGWRWGLERVEKGRELGGEVVGRAREGVEGWVKGR